MHKKVVNNRNDRTQKGVEDLVNEQDNGQASSEALELISEEDKKIKDN